jgi:hypothetical protein
VLAEFDRLAGVNAASLPAAALPVITFPAGNSTDESLSAEDVQAVRDFKTLALVREHAAATPSASEIVTAILSPIRAATACRCSIPPPDA